MATAFRPPAGDTSWKFAERQRQAYASQLCDLTGGLHIHMIRVPDEDTYRRIVKGLKELDILADAE